MNYKVETILEAGKLSGKILRSVLESWRVDASDSVDYRIDGIVLTLCGWMTVTGDSDAMPYFSVQPYNGEDAEIDCDSSVLVPFLSSDAELGLVADYWADTARTNIEEVARLPEWAR